VELIQTSRSSIAQHFLEVGEDGGRVVETRRYGFFAEYNLRHKQIVPFWRYKMKWPVRIGIGQWNRAFDQ